MFEPIKPILIFCMTEASKSFDNPRHYLFCECIVTQLCGLYLICEHALCLQLRK